MLTVIYDHCPFVNHTLHPSLLALSLVLSLLLALMQPLVQPRGSPERVILVHVIVERITEPGCLSELLE